MKLSDEIRRLRHLPGIMIDKWADSIDQLERQHNRAVDAAKLAQEALRKVRDALGLQAMLPESARSIVEERNVLRELVTALEKKCKGLEEEVVRMRKGSIQVRTSC